MICSLQNGGHSVSAKTCYIRWYNAKNQISWCLAELETLSWKKPGQVLFVPADTWRNVIITPRRFGVIVKFLIPPPNVESYVFISVGLSVCFSMYNITEKRVNGFPWNFQDRSGMIKGTIYKIWGGGGGGSRLNPRLLGSFFYASKKIRAS